MGGRAGSRGGTSSLFYRHFPRNQWVQGKENHHDSPNWERVKVDVYH
mgnify:CR=1 FL=1